MCESRSPCGLFTDFWKWRLRNFPEFATSIGCHKHDGDLHDFSLAAYESRKKEAMDYLTKVEPLEISGHFSLSDTLSLRLLKNDLKQFVAGFACKSYLFPLNQLEGPQTDFSRLISYMKTDTLQDYELILERYGKFPQQIDQIIELLDAGIKLGYTMSNISVNPVPSQLDTVLSKDPSETAFHKPFQVVSPNVGEPQWSDLVTSSLQLVENSVFPAFRKLKDYLLKVYIPNARTSISAGDLPNGQEYYQMCLEFHTTTTLSAQVIHNIGKAEVQRILQRMKEVKNSLKFDGSLKDFRQFLRTDSRFVLRSSEDILESYRKICKKIEAVLPQIFRTFPKAPFRIIEVPDEVAPNFPGAYYLAPPGDGSRPGTFYVNTYKPESRKTYEYVSLALHEAIPGHHHQASVMLEAEAMPEFRRFFEDMHYAEVPGRFAMNTAYIEGWGLYSEFLGEELGLYDDPYDLFGRLSHEMLRAVRLVVDTGMHAFGWSREESIDYMLANTAMAANDAKAEVERYITWPGQACAYKIGEIKLKELREKAMSALGKKFDLGEFHDLILLSGALPLHTLEEQVDVFISKKQ